MRRVKFDCHLAARDNHGHRVKLSHGLADIRFRSRDGHYRRVQTIDSSVFGIFYIVTRPHFVPRRHVKAHFHQRILLRHRVVVVKLKHHLVLPSHRALGDLRTIELKLCFPINFKHGRVSNHRDFAPVATVDIGCVFSARAPKRLRSVLARRLRTTRVDPAEHQRLTITRSNSNHTPGWRRTPMHRAHIRARDRARRPGVTFKSHPAIFTQRYRPRHPSPAREHAAFDGILRIRHLPRARSPRPPRTRARNPLARLRSRAASV